MQQQLKVTLPPAVAEALRLEAVAQDRSLSYVAAAILIAHFKTGELPPRAGRPVPPPENANRAGDLVNSGIADAARESASATADKYFPKAPRRKARP